MIFGIKHFIRTGKPVIFQSAHMQISDGNYTFKHIGIFIRIWLMKKELRKVPFVGTACAVAGHIFVDRSNPRAALQSVELVKKELVDGISTVIFPEGTRTKTGEMGRFKQGAFKIAMDLNLPVVPLSLTGFYDAMPSGQAFVNPRARVRLHIGEPIDISQFADINEAMAHLRTKIESGIHNA